MRCKNRGSENGGTHTVLKSVVLIEKIKMFAENVYSLRVRLEHFYFPRRHKPDFNTEHNGSLNGKEKKIADGSRAFTVVVRGRLRGKRV